VLVIVQILNAEQGIENVPGGSENRVIHPVLYEDDDWLAVEKPIGISTHASRPGDTGLVEWLGLHRGHTLHVCSRLDKGTSGVLLFARHPHASAQAQEIHEQHKSQKKYLFISRSCHKSGRKWRVAEPLDGKECCTDFHLVDGGHGYFCYEALIERGRTHQIRRHAAFSGVPILGDTRYGGESFLRLCLHCREVNWPEIGTVASGQPDSFSLLLAGQSGLVLEGAVGWERRTGWPGLVTNSFRLIQRGEVSLPVSIDLYDSFLSITAFSREVDSSHLKVELQPLLDYLATKVACRGGILRYHSRNPHRKKLIHDALCWGDLPTEPVMAREYDLSFAVSLNDSQHSGLFLDQRDSRRRIHQISRGRRVANLFAFTCSFSAVAVAGGAEVVFSVDLAASSLARGKDNFAVNGLDAAGRGKFIREDVIKWLARQERKRAADPRTFCYWDLIICDPPVFASAGKRRAFHVEKQWPELARQIRLLLSERGVALFANNHRSGSTSFYLQELQKHFRIVTLLAPPMDFPVIAGEPEEVRIYWCEL